MYHNLGGDSSIPFAILYLLEASDRSYHTQGEKVIPGCGGHPSSAYHSLSLKNKNQQKNYG